jgi:hypothetical protein
LISRLGQKLSFALPLSRDLKSKFQSGAIEREMAVAMLQAALANASD